MANFQNCTLTLLVIFLVYTKYTWFIDCLKDRILNSNIAEMDDERLVLLYHRSKLKMTIERYDLILSPKVLTDRPRRMAPKRTSTSHIMMLILLCCGDIETKPGPRTPKYPCTSCEKAVTKRSKAISCDTCDRWTHVKCTNSFSTARYDEIVNSDESFEFYCAKCLLNELPVVNADTEPDTYASENAVLDHTQPEPDDGPVTTYPDVVLPRKGLHFIHLNARSLRNKLPEVTILAEQTQAAVIAVSETWFDSSVTNAEASISGYNLIRKDRSSAGGGVCIYIRNDLAYNPRQDLDLCDLEAVWLDLLLVKTKPILVGCLYRPPTQSDFTVKLQEILFDLPQENETVLLGDFNIDLKNSKNCALVKNYNSLLRTCGLTQIISEPTRVTDTTSSLLDHILVSDVNKYLKHGVMPIGYSDHCLIFCTRKVNYEAINKHCVIKLRSLKHYSVNALTQLINNQNWDEVTNAENVNDAWIKFESIFRVLINKVAPKKHCRIKVRTQPWITHDILVSIRERDKHLKNFHRNKDQISLQQFRKWRNKTQQLVKEAKKDFISNEIESNKNNSKKLWDSLKLLGYQNKPKTKEHTVLKIDNEICFDPVTVAEHINDFFINVAHRLTADLPPMSDIHSAFSTKCKSFYSKLKIQPGTVNLEEIDQDFVNKELKKLVPTKGVGLDEISPRFLRDGADSLTNIVTFLINFSIRTKIVPDCIKVAKVTPLHKKNSKLDVGNYRPVSVLSSLSKILEKAVHLQVEAHCKRYQLLYQLQSGFRGNYSTDTCLIYLHDLIRKEVSNGNVVGILLLDVQKAFDSVDHVHLCEKIRLAGLDPSWFSSYLQNVNKLLL